MLAHAAPRGLEETVAGAASAREGGTLHVLPLAFLKATRRWPQDPAPTRRQVWALARRCHSRYRKAR